MGSYREKGVSYKYLFNRFQNKNLQIWSWISNANSNFLAFFGDNQLIGFLSIYVHVIPGFYVFVSTFAFDGQVSY